jgi:hypothetical protein
MNEHKPKIVFLALFWSLVLAAVMTLLGLVTEGAGVSDPETGALSWARVGLVFGGWFLFSAAVMLLAGLAYRVLAPRSARRED